VRYRVDGVCVERERVPKSVQGAVTARLKLMSASTSREAHPAGRAYQAGDRRQADRLPGELAALLPRREHRAAYFAAGLSAVGIQALGFEEDDYQAFIKIIKRPTGFSWSPGRPVGKTTRCTRRCRMNRPDKRSSPRKTRGVQLPGMNQCQVREEISLSFARILRSMLRQAPNIILVGEIRDLEVARWPSRRH